MNAPRALIADGFWTVPAGDGNDGAHRAAVQWIKSVDGTRCRVRLCEEVRLPNGRALAPGATRTISSDAFEDLGDDDLS